jgi:hypothetical protein
MEYRYITMYILILIEITVFIWLFLIFGSRTTWIQVFFYKLCNKMNKLFGSFFRQSWNNYFGTIWKLNVYYLKRKLGLHCAPSPLPHTMLRSRTYMIFTSIAQSCAIGNSRGTNIVMWGGGRVIFMYECTICNNSLNAACLRDALIVFVPINHRANGAKRRTRVLIPPRYLHPGKRKD